MYTVTAPGKLMLMGEHAVVYGYPCLVTAVDQRLSAAAEQTETHLVEVVSPDCKDTRFVDAAIRIFCKNLHLKNNGLKITTASPFSNVFGFGSSSAVTVATIKALATVFNQNLSPKQIFDIAYAVVLDVQKTGSGFDVAAASFGGTIYYIKGGQTITQVPFIKSADKACFVVGYSGVKSNTVDIVNQVAAKKEKYPDIVERIFSAINKLVEDGKKVMMENNWERLGKLFDFNQEYLRDLGVSSEKLESLISAAKHVGAWGAKLSGAGRGDCMVAIGPKDKKTAIESAINNAGGEVVNIVPNAEGVRAETDFKGN